jgi:membrane protein
LSTAAEPGRRQGRAPSSRLGPGEWVDVLKRTFKQFLADDCMGLAQQIAFSALLAFFPAVAFLIGLLGLFHLFDNVESLLATVAPHGVIRFVDGLHSDSQVAASAVAFAIGFLGALWAASGAIGAVIKAVNRADEREESRPFWKVRLIAIALVLLSGFVFAGVLLLIVFGGPLGRAIARKADLGHAFDLVWGILRWPIAFAAILLFFSIVYHFAPDRGPRPWRWATPGSVLGSVLFLLLSGLFALYVHYAGSYTRTYGAIASGIILLLWFNYSAWAILLGAELNSELEREGRSTSARGG